MTTEKVVLQLLLDAGVPDSVGQAFKDDGHKVTLHREVLPESTPDAVVCTTAMKNDAILVACDGDMKQMAKSFGVSRDRFKRLNLIKLSCSEPVAAKRVEQAMKLIELEYQYSTGKKARRLFLEIKNNTITTHR